MNLIDEFLPQVSPASSTQQPESQSAATFTAIDDDRDVSDLLTEMCEQTKKGVAPGQRPVKQLDIGAKHTIYLTVEALSADELYRLVDTMVDECQKANRCRFLSRCVPVEDVVHGGRLGGLSMPIQL